MRLGGVLFEQSRSRHRTINVRHTWTRAALASSRAIFQSLNAACANAVSTHCIAKVHAATRRQVAETTLVVERPTNSTVCHPRVLVGPDRAPTEALACCRYGIRTRDTQITVWCSCH